MKLICKIRKKLNNSSGMSILFALLIFLVAVMVCSVLVAAAYTSAKAVRNDYDEEQAFLTIESAEKLIEADIDGGKLSFIEHWEKSGDSVKEDSKTTYFVNAWLNDICRDSITEMMEEILVEDSISSPVRTFTIEAADEKNTGEASEDDDKEEDSLDNVEMTLTITNPAEAEMTDESEKYQLTAVFTLKKDGKLNNRTYPSVTAVFRCSVDDSKTPEADTYKTKETVYTWSLFEVTRGETGK